MAFHLAESAEQARQEAVLSACTAGTTSTTSTRSDARKMVAVDDPWDLLERTTSGGTAGAGAAVIGTPDELVAMIRHLQELTGGFGVVLGFAHDWANREATFRSWSCSPAT